MFPEGGNDTIHLLWTGGWDSTFRLLAALHMEEAAVRPHYVLDPASPCTEMELDAMQRVRSAVMRARPELAERLLPTTSASLDDLLEDDGHAERFARLSERSPLDERLEWLARYAKHAGLEELEVGCHRGAALATALDGNLRRVREKPFSTYRLSDEARATDLGVLERFTFSLVDLSRGDMRRIALERGFLETLDLTWFCRTPRRGEPCGVCDKCHDAVVDGFGYRLSPNSRRLHDIKWFTRWGPWQTVVSRVVG